MTTWTWNGREVTSPWAKALLAVHITLWLLLGAVRGIIWVTLIVVLFPVWFLVDRILKMCGRRGFARVDYSIDPVDSRPVKNFKVAFDLEAFRGNN